MRIFYSLGLQFYVAAIHVVALFNVKAKNWVQGRKGIFKKISETTQSFDKTAWFHVSSLGEFEQGRPVIEALKEKHPDFKIVLTFFSPSGYEVRKDYKGADAVFYLPMDSARNARKFVNLINPTIAFFVKYDFWFYYLNELQKNKVPTYIFSAIFRKNQLFFKWYGKWYRNMLNKFTHIFVQNKNSKDLLASIGISNVEIGGDTRFDRVYEIAKESKDFNKIEQFCDGNRTIVAGSTWERDEQLHANYLKALGKNTKLILAPHEIHKSNIKRITDLFKNNCICYSELSETTNSNVQVLIIDSIGMLSSIYKYANVATIGGGFGAGIHNTLEAATYGIPIVFGPKFQKFQEARDLISEKAAFSIKNQEEFNHILDKLLKNELERKTSGNFAINYVNKMRGGSKLILSRIAI